MSKPDRLTFSLSELLTKTGDRVEGYDQDGILTDSSVISEVSPVSRIEGSAVVIEAQTITVAPASEILASERPAIEWTEETWKAGLIRALKETCDAFGLPYNTTFKPETGGYFDGPVVGGDSDLRS
jgi:hypothetical protein